MAEQKLQISQSQSLVMTPQLQQAIKLLQLNNLELSAYLEMEMEKNPLLEKKDGEAEREETAEAEEYEASEREEPPLDVEDSAYYSDQNVTDWQARKHNIDSERSFEETHAEDETLAEHLSAQIQLSIENSVDRLIATYLIGSLDDAGYLKADLKEIADQLKCPVTRIEGVLAQVQQFDPAGCFARSLQECLALQLKDQNRFDPAIDILLQNLQMLADGKIDELVRLCGTNMEDLADMIADIKTCNPKPGERFRHEEAETLIPDIMLRAAPDGGWHVELNSQTLPRVLVNNKYYAEISTRTRDKEEKRFLSDCHQSASWLVRALEQRANTILKVAIALVSEQDAFFRYGIEHLRPITLKTIAERISMHESTVSRVTANKYIATPRGVFELKYFFTSGITSAAGGEDHSAEFVRHKIREAIEHESPKKPLSDDKLVKILQQQGIDVARRTVAKYREQMNIGSSTDRKKQHAREAVLKR